MTERDIDVNQVVTVKLDESKFTKEFMKEFREYFYDYFTLDDHFRHLAQLAARGLIDTPCFIEGYGDSADMGIEITVQR